MAMDIGETAVNAILSPCQLCVVDTKQVQNRCMEIVGIGRVFSSLECKLIALAIRNTRLDTRTPNPADKRSTIMVAALATLCKRCATKLSRPNDQCILIQTTRLQVTQQSRDWFVDTCSHRRQLSTDISMVVPVVDRSLRATPHLREADSTLGEARRKQTPLTEVIRVWCPNSVGILDGLRLA